ncbi:hypothetical protein IAQ61_009132 [Plenodomus lingam]|uniref:uncharacterized protein n=1 Tax=Leptosphaeria maculans TaxID=5022 RepID=UPI003321B1CA|nr:hypothetical protein IAQ61_009132 [Plenodomus lingam]
MVTLAASLPISIGSGCEGETDLDSLDRYLSELLKISSLPYRPWRTSAPSAKVLPSPATTFQDLDRSLVMETRLIRAVKHSIDMHIWSFNLQISHHHVFESLCPPQDSSTMERAYTGA